VLDPNKGHAFGRLAETLRQVFASGPEGLWMVMWDRGGYGPAAMAVIADHPWVGVGPGLFGSLVPGYAIEVLGSPLPADNAQNWWRHHIAELGLPGALPGLVCSLLAAWALLRRPGAATASLAGIGLLALMSPPTPHPLLYVVAGLVIAHAVAAAPDAPAPVRSGRQALAVWALGLLCAVLAFVAGGQDLRPAYRAMRFHQLYSYGVTGTETTPWGQGRWMARRAVAVLQPTGATLVARVIVPHGDAAAKPVQVTISTRDGVVCRHTAQDATPFECRMAASSHDWMLVRVEVSRAWQTVDGTERAAVVNAHFEP
jgi:O-antigen ligase